MSDSIITVKNFAKSFGRKKVIKDLSFEVEKGEIFAFLGANGSGKTTTIRTLLNIYKPDNGELLIDGKPYSPNDAQILGYLPEERGLYLSSKVLETMIYFGQLKGLTKEDAQSNAIKYLKRVELMDKTQETIKKLSSGQQQKIQLGITVINDPKLLILDEPTKGLDPVNRNLLLELLMEMNQKGTTIIFSTHQMEEAEKIADRILMIKNGERRLYGQIDEVKAQFGSNTIHVRFNGKFPSNSKLFHATVSHHVAEITPGENVSTNEVLKYLLSKVEVIDFKIGVPSLNEIFIKISQAND